jgi:hypothetical protein
LRRARNMRFSQFTNTVYRTQSSSFQISIFCLVLSYLNRVGISCQSLQSSNIVLINSSPSSLDSHNLSTFFSVSLTFSPPHFHSLDSFPSMYKSPWVVWVPLTTLNWEFITKLLIHTKVFRTSTSGNMKTRTR